jgi:hypothetical protein
MISKINNQNWKLDIPGNRITFLDSRWYYDMNGNAVPSVTTILEAYPKGYGFYKWLKENGEDADDIRDEAGRKGSTVHRLTEQYDEGLQVSLLKKEFQEDAENNESGARLSISLSEWNMFEKYVEFSNRYPHENVLTEFNLIDAELGYGGTLDRVKYFPTSLCSTLLAGNVLVDIKTGGYASRTWFLQLAAYKRAAVKQGYIIDDVAILWLNAKTKGDRKDCVQGKGWQLLTRTADEQLKDLNLFKHTHALWLAENGDMQPREISYQLTHIKKQTQ